MNFKKKVSGSWTDTPHYIHNTSTDTITTLPADIYPTGTTATVGLKGNTLQSSIPSPTSPVMPQGTGERTGNLFDAATAYGDMYSDGVITGLVNAINSIKNKVTSDMIGKTYTISITPLQIPSKAFVAMTINGTIYWRENELTVNQRSSFQFTPVTENDQWYITYDSSGICSYKDIMINEGSTALPYEPYGYFIEIEVS